MFESRLIKIKHLIRKNAKNVFNDIDKKRPREHYHKEINILQIETI